MVLKNPGKKGSDGEREVRDILISWGYSVTRSAGSLGPFDLVAVRSELPKDISKSFHWPHKHHWHPVLLVSVKRNEDISAVRRHMKEIRAFSNYPKCAEKVLFWRRNREPWRIGRWYRKK